MPLTMDLYEADESFIEVIDLSTDKPRVLAKKESLGSEKQISVDPISLREPSDQQLVMHPVPTSAKVDLLIPLPPPKSKFLSQSLPNSANSSPRLGSNMSKKKSKDLSQPSSLSLMVRQDSISLANIESLHEINLLRSKSCGEGRASVPPEDFDLCLKKIDNVKHEENHKHNYTNYYKIEAEVDDNKKGGEENMDRMDEKFKCRALCLYLPGFHKGKPVKARRQGSDMSQSKESDTGHVVSKRVSLEKFDCASWNSSGLMDEGDASNLFFDLPLELIKCSVNDTDSPVTTAFVFDKEPKPVLKKSSSKSASRKSNESVRHVRFSTSSPTSYPATPTSCITPRLHKATDDFSTFLEAQSALNVL